MSYDIYIGEAAIDPPHLEDAADGYNEIRTTVERLAQPNAPRFPGDVCTENENHRHPSYGGWSTFCEETGLVDLFFDKRTGLMREHPGTFRLLPSHLETVWAAVKGWKKTHKRKPGFEEGEDFILARLIWLEWWMSWALENCRVPSIHNH